MIDMDFTLGRLREMAKADPAFADQILATEQDPQPLTAFCDLAAKAGYPITEMDLIAAGEDAYAAMRRSTNGGGENSPLLEGEDDYYELFLAQIKWLKGKQA